MRQLIHDMACRQVGGNKNTFAQQLHLKTSSEKYGPYYLGLMC